MFPRVLKNEKKINNSRLAAVLKLAMDPEKVLILVSVV